LCTILLFALETLTKGILRVTARLLFGHRYPFLQHSFTPKRVKSLTDLLVWKFLETDIMLKNILALPVPSRIM